MRRVRVHTPTSSCAPRLARTRWRGAGLGALLALVVLTCAPRAWAYDPPLPRETPSQRQGWLLGLVLGRASGDFTVNDGVRSATTGWSGGGRVLRGRLGRFLTPELQVSVEYGVWRRAAEGDSTAADTGTGTAGWVAPVDRYLGSGFFAISLYPRLDGFSLRAGLGYGRGLAQGVVDGVVVRRDATGPMLLMGLSYEFAISRDLSLALGADFGRLEAGDELSGNFAQFLATFQLHLGQGLPRRWF